MFLDMLFLCEMRKMGTQNTYTEDAKILANTKTDRHDYNC